MRLPFRHLGSLDAFCRSILQVHFTLRANFGHSQAGTQVLDYLFTLYVAPLRRCNHDCGSNGNPLILLGNDLFCKFQEQASVHPSTGSGRTDAGFSRSRCPLDLHLYPDEFGIRAGGVQEFVVGALLGDAPVVENDDLVRVAYG